MIFWDYSKEECREMDEKEFNMDFHLLLLKIIILIWILITWSTFVFDFSVTSNFILWFIWSSISTFSIISYIYNKQKYDNERKIPIWINLK